MKGELRQAIKDAPFGKKVGGSLYLLNCGVHLLPPIFAEMRKEAIAIADDPMFWANVIKFCGIDNSVSFMAYPWFQEEVHPELHTSQKINLNPPRVGKVIDYTNRKSPPILHRRELFIPQDWLQYKRWKELTEREEHLLNRRDIGTKKTWEKVNEDASK